MAIRYAGDKNLIGYGKAQVFEKDTFVEQAAKSIGDRQAQWDKANAARAKAAAAAKKAKLKAEKKFLDDANEIPIGKCRRIDTPGIFEARDAFLKNRQDNITAILAGDADAISQDRQLEGQFRKSIITSEGLERERLKRTDLIQGDTQWANQDNMEIHNKISETSIFDPSWSSVYTTDEASGDETFVSGVENMSTLLRPSIDVNSIIQNAVKDIDEDLINAEYTNRSKGTEIITKKSVADNILSTAALGGVNSSPYPEYTIEALEQSAKQHGDKYMVDGNVDIDAYILDVAKGYSNRGLSLSYYKDSKASKSDNDEEISLTEDDIVIPSEAMNTEVSSGVGSFVLPIGGNISGKLSGGEGIEHESKRAEWTNVMGVPANSESIDFSGSSPTVLYAPQGNSVIASSKPTKNAKRTFQVTSGLNARNVSSRKTKSGQLVAPGLIGKSEVFDISPTDVRVMRTATKNISVDIRKPGMLSDDIFKLNIKKGDWVPEWALESTNKDVQSALKGAYTDMPWLIGIDEHKTSKPTIAFPFNKTLLNEWSQWMKDNQENPYLYINAMNKEFFGVEGESK